MSVVSLPRNFRVRLLENPDHDSLLEFLGPHFAETVYIRSLIHEFGVTPTTHIEHGRFLGGERDGRLKSLVFLGNSRNLTTVGETEDLAPLLEYALRDQVRPRLFVGPIDHAPLVRRTFAGDHRKPFLDREQAYYLLTPRTLASLEEVDIRRAGPEDVEDVARAQVAMTEEDLLIPKGHIDLARLREISSQRIDAGKVWILRENGTLVFKTEESARAETEILVGGVFTHPGHRGRGLATRGMATWCRRLFEEGLTRIALHVNARNTPAVKAYERAGFERHSMLRLMLAY